MTHLDIESIGDYFARYDKDAILMQGTGLADKNNLEIWEGDVVKIFDTIADIRYLPKWAGWVFYDRKRRADQADLPIGGEPPNYPNCEIIGNKFQHPELLK